MEREPEKATPTSLAFTLLPASNAWEDQQRGVYDVEALEREFASLLDSDQPIKEEPTKDGVAKPR